MNEIRITGTGSATEVCAAVERDRLPGAQQICFPLEPESLPRDPPLFIDALHQQAFELARQASPDTHSSVGPQPFLACLHDAVLADHMFVVVDASGLALTESFFHRPRLLERALERQGSLSDGVLRIHRRLELDAILLGSPWSNGFYHWLTDVLPRFRLLEPLLDRPEYAHLPFVTTPLTPFQRETLLLMGIAPERVLEFDLSVWQFRRLYVPSPMSHHMSTTPGNQQWLRETFRVPQDGPPGRLYLSRANTDRRRVVNEDALRRMLLARGVTILEGGERPFLEQAAHFAAARFVLAPHGGALADLAFCAPGATVVELMPETHLAFPFYNLARCNDLPYLFVLHEAVGESSDMRVDVDQIEAFLG